MVSDPLALKVYLQTGQELGYFAVSKGSLEKLQLIVSSILLWIHQSIFRMEAKYINNNFLHPLP